MSILKIRTYGAIVRFADYITCALNRLKLQFSSNSVYRRRIYPILRISTICYLKVIR